MSRIASFAAGLILLLGLLAPRYAVAMDQPPTTVPDDVESYSFSISFYNFTSSFYNFNSSYYNYTLSDEERAFAPKPPVPEVEGLEVTEEDGGVRYTLSADILFDFDKATLRPAATKALEAMSADVRQRFTGGAVFLVEGHTDAKGSDDYNLKLSVKRATSVKTYLAKEQGFDAGTIETVGRGESNPKAPNETPDGQDDPDGRQKNRRVEILVKPKA